MSLAFKKRKSGPVGHLSSPSVRHPANLSMSWNSPVPSGCRLPWGEPSQLCSLLCSPGINIVGTSWPLKTCDWCESLAHDILTYSSEICQNGGKQSLVCVLLDSLFFTVLQHLCHLMWKWPCHSPCRDVWEGNSIRHHAARTKLGWAPEFIDSVIW